MAGVQTITIPHESDDTRLDRFLRKNFPALKQGMIEKMCRKGELRVDGGRVKANTHLLAGQSLRIPPIPDGDDQPERAARISDKDVAMMQSLVLYKDDDLIALNKPFGLAVQGGSKTTRHIDGLSEALKFGRDNKPMLVHRLDRDTTGVLLMARHALAAKKLSALFQSRDMEKVYWALVAGVPNPREGRISIGLVKAPGHGDQGEGEKMLPVRSEDVQKTEGAKHATTDYLLLENAGQRMSWLAMSPLTGRTHQLRAHADAIGHPIIGDGKYGGSKRENQGEGWGSGVGGDIENSLHLHARSIAFQHPFTNKPITLKAPLPPHMKSTWELFGWTQGREYDEMWTEAREDLR